MLSADAVHSGRGVVLRHLQDLDAADLNRVKSLAEREGSARPPLVLTMDLDTAADHVHALVGQIATSVRLPALRDMREHVTSLVADTVSGMPEPSSGTTFSSDALQALVMWDWPGNIAELRRTVEATARRLPSRTVGVPDLPHRMRQERPHRT